MQLPNLSVIMLFIKYYFLVSATFLTAPPSRQGESRSKSAYTSGKFQRQPISGIPESVLEMKQNLKPGMWTEVSNYRCVCGCAGGMWVCVGGGVGVAVTVCVQV